MIRARDDRDAGPVALAEEAVALLRTAPAGVLLAYYVGAMPFALGMFRFASDGMRGTAGDGGLAVTALGMAGLFLWMKTWQAVFAACLAARLRGDAPPRWTVRRVARLVYSQLAIQPWGLLILPLTVISVVLFAPAYAFFQHVTALGDEAAGDLRALRQRAGRGAVKAPRQSLGALWLLSPWPTGIGLLVAFGGAYGVARMADANLFPEDVPWFALGLALLFVAWPLSPLGMVVAVNVAAVLLLAPRVALLLSDRAAPFVIASVYGAVSVPFLVAVLAGVYLVMDPAVKAAFVVRIFHEEARRTGADLAVALAGCRAARRRGALLALLLLGGAALPARAPATEPSAPVAASTDEHKALDGAIDAVLQRPEYRWRVPRERQPKASRPGVLAGFVRGVVDALGRAVRWVGRGLGRAFRWIEDRFFRRSAPAWLRLPGRRSGPDTAYGVLFVGLAIACVGGALLLWRRRRRAPAPAALDPLPARPVDVANAAPSALPGEEWLALARDLAAAGDLRLALRARFLAGLAFLSDAELVRLRPFKTNLDYLRDLQVRAHVYPELVQAFDENLRVFDRTWYGLHVPPPSALDLFIANLEILRAHARTA